MERRRSGRGGWGRSLGIFIRPRVQRRETGMEKPSNLVGLTGILSAKSYAGKRVTKISRLV